MTYLHIIKEIKAVKVEHNLAIDLDQVQRLHRLLHDLVNENEADANDIREVVPTLMSRLPMFT